MCRSYPYTDGTLGKISFHRKKMKKNARTTDENTVREEQHDMCDAVSLGRAGASLVEMQVAGRWKESRMPAHYAKAELAERGAIARFKEK